MGNLFNVLDEFLNLVYGPANTLQKGKNISRQAGGILGSNGARLCLLRDGGGIAMGGSRKQNRRAKIPHSKLKRGGGGGSKKLELDLKVESNARVGGREKKTLTGA